MMVVALQVFVPESRTIQVSIQFTAECVRMHAVEIVIIIIIVYFRHRVHRNYNKTTQRTNRKHTEIYTKRPIRCRE